MPFFLRMALQGLGSLIPFKSLLFIGLAAGFIGSVVLFVKVRDANLIEQAKASSDAVWSEKIANANLKLEQENSDAKDAARNIIASSADRAERVRICKSEAPYCRQDGF